MILKKLLSSFFPHHMKRQVRELFGATILLNLALALVIIFEPIYLYQIGYSLQQIMLFYLIVYVAYLVLMPLGGKFSRSKGYELGLFVGSVFYALFYITLFFIAIYPWLFFVAPIIFALQKMFYWPAYYADFARFSDDQEEGREISSFNIAISLVYIVGTVIAGFIITTWGYGALFFIASLIFLASNIPTLITRENFKPGSFSYWGAFKMMFDKKNRKALLAYFGFGEELVVLVIWPIFISIIITDLFNLSILVSLATLVTMLVTMYIGKLVDSKNKRSILALGSSFYSFAWFMRLFVFNQFGVFFVDTMSRLAKNVIVVPLTAITYERAKSKKIMQTIVFFEMSLVIGKLIAIIIIYAALFFVADEIIAFKLTFILAGCMSLLYMLL
ncbi:MFS transporter [bacterium]|jgi:MFS family permease|nr:MFS transporter [bacterium]MBT4649345.1 MFS transporter [bacterium]